MLPMTTGATKAEVQAFWDAAACGEIYGEGFDGRHKFELQRKLRYELESFIPAFARFEEAAGADVLEIGVGMGADHVEWARARPRRLVGVDLTPRAIELTHMRCSFVGVHPALCVGDAEHLAHPDNEFDIVYSWGVLHHSPDTPAAVREVRRVLRPSGVARVMVYHRASIVGALLWLRYGLAKGKPTLRLDQVYSMYLESPGTKAYSIRQVQELFRTAGFTSVSTSIELSVGDLLQGAAGQRHEGGVLELARKVWPRSLVRGWGRRFGLFLLIEAR